LLDDRNSILASIDINTTELDADDAHNDDTLATVPQTALDSSIILTEQKTTNNSNDNNSDDDTTVSTVVDMNNLNSFTEYQSDINDQNDADENSLIIKSDNNKAFLNVKNRSKSYDTRQHQQDDNEPLLSLNEQNINVSAKNLQSLQLKIANESSLSRNDSILQSLAQNIDKNFKPSINARAISNDSLNNNQSIKKFHRQIGGDSEASDISDNNNNNPNQNKSQITSMLSGINSTKPRNNKYISHLRDSFLNLPTTETSSNNKRCDSLESLKRSVNSTQLTSPLANENSSVSVSKNTNTIDKLKNRLSKIGNSQMNINYVAELPNSKTVKHGFPLINKTLNEKVSQNTPDSNQRTPRSIQKYKKTEKSITSDLTEFIDKYYRQLLFFHSFLIINFFFLN
jgi:hypothetical protein